MNDTFSLCSDIASFKTVPTDIITIVNTFSERKHPAGQIAFQSPFPSGESFYSASWDDVFIFGRNTSCGIVELRIYDWNRGTFKFHSRSSSSCSSGPFLTIDRNGSYISYHSVAMEYNTIYIIVKTEDPDMTQINVHNFDGFLQTLFRIPNMLKNSRRSPHIDVHNGALWVLDNEDFSGPSHLRNFSKQGKLLSHFILPVHIQFYCLDFSQNLYISDLDKIYKMKLSGGGGCGDGGGGGARGGGGDNIDDKAISSCCDPMCLIYHDSSVIQLFTKIYCDPTGSFLTVLAHGASGMFLFEISTTDGKLRVICEHPADTYAPTSIISNGGITTHNSDKSVICFK